jgi:adenine-specific DNA-methyltransferase
MSEEKLWELHADGRVWWGTDGNNVPAPKIFLSEVKQGRVPQTLWTYNEVGHTQEAKKNLIELVNFADSEGVFDTPKPSRLIQQTISIGASIGESDIILDFCAGSGTTAQAVLELNQPDGGNRKFILVQLPEPTGRADYPTIAEITKERVRRVIQKLNEADAGKLPLDGVCKQDRGFRVFRLAESNFQPWQANAPKDAKSLEQQLNRHINHIREDRHEDDILYELMLKSGYPLTTPVETLTLAGKQVYSVAEGLLLICLERGLTLELIRSLAARTPQRALCLDEGFAGNDQLKANAAKIFETTRVESFMTV